MISAAAYTAHSAARAPQNGPGGQPGPRRREFSPKIGLSIDLVDESSSAGGDVAVNQGSLLLAAVGGAAASGTGSPSVP
jgi:hypothetical protein